MNGKRFLRYPEAQEHLRELGLSLATSTLRRMVSQKRIPYIKVPGSKAVLFSPSSLESWIASAGVEPRRPS